MFNCRIKLCRLLCLNQRGNTSSQSSLTFLMRKLLPSGCQPNTRFFSDVASIKGDLKIFLSYRCTHQASGPLKSHITSPKTQAQNVACQRDVNGDDPPSFLSPKIELSTKNMGHYLLKSIYSILVHILQRSKKKTLVPRFCWRGNKHGPNRTAESLQHSHVRST
jgi:hypothetical protein